MILIMNWFAFGGPRSLYTHSRIDIEVYVQFVLELRLYVCNVQRIVDFYRQMRLFHTGFLENLMANDRVES